MSADAEVVWAIVTSIAASSRRTPGSVQRTGSRVDSGPIGMRPEADAMDRQANTEPIVTVLIPAALA